MKFKSRVASALGGFALLGASIFMATPAQAAEGVPPTPPAPNAPSVQSDTVPERPVYGTTYRVEGVSFQGNWTDYAHPIAQCMSSGGTCAITAGRTSTTTIDITAGITRDQVAAGLGISASQSVSLSVGCTSPTLGAKQIWMAFARGRHFEYQIIKTTVLPGSSGSESLGFFHAFVAYDNQIVCQLG